MKSLFKSPHRRTGRVHISRQTVPINQYTPYAVNCRRQGIQNRLVVRVGRPFKSKNVINRKCIRVEPERVIVVAVQIVEVRRYGVALLPKPGYDLR